MDNIWVWVGLQITGKNDPLTKISLSNLMLKIKNPKLPFIQKITQLRITKQIDIVKYKELKKDLPYFTCALFHPNIRIKQNFAAINCFVLDLDNLSKYPTIDITQLKHQFKQNNTILSFFISPGADGLKLIFKLKQPCKDAAHFSAFYKTFALNFAKEYNLDNVVDYSTSDVTRACFVSFDPDAYYNPNATPIDLDLMLPAQSLFTSQFKATQKTFGQNKQLAIKQDKQELTHDSLLKIKQSLNIKVKLANQKTYYSPPEIDKIIDLLPPLFLPHQIFIEQILPIHYGKKLKLICGLYWAEINVFFGKNGYSVVKTPKNGSNFDLADIGYTIIYNLIHNYAPPS